MQINCLCDLNKRFLFVVVVVIVVAIVAFAFASTFVLFSIIFVLIFVFFILTLIFFAFLISLLFVIILFVLFVFFNSFFNCNIERTCESKKIKTKLIIYNSYLILLLRIYLRTKSLCCVFFNNKLHY